MKNKEQVELIAKAVTAFEKGELTSEESLFVIGAICRASQGFTRKDIQRARDILTRIGI